MEGSEVMGVSSNHPKLDYFGIETHGSPIKPNKLFGGFLKWGYPQNHPISVEFSNIINHPFWGIPIEGNPQSGHSGHPKISGINPSDPQ